MPSAPQTGMKMAGQATAAAATRALPSSTRPISPAATPRGSATRLLASSMLAASMPALQGQRPSQATRAAPPATHTLLYVLPFLPHTGMKVRGQGPMTGSMGPSVITPAAAAAAPVRQGQGPSQATCAPALLA